MLLGVIKIIIFRLVIFVILFFIDYEVGNKKVYFFCVVFILLKRYKINICNIEIDYINED